MLFARLIFPCARQEPKCRICKDVLVFLRQLAGARRTPESQESQGIMRLCAFCDAKNFPARATSRNAEFTMMYKSFYANWPVPAARQNHKNHKEL